MNLRRWRVWLTAHPNPAFWLIFGLLNCLLFAPGLLTSESDTSLWAAVAEGWREPARLWHLLAIWRPSPDVARLHLEWLLLVAAWLGLGRLRNGLLRHLFFALYLFALIYAVYEAAMHTLYQTEPVFYSQYRMLTEGLAFLLENVNVPFYYFVLAAAGSALGGLLLYTLFRLLTSEAVVGRLSFASRSGLGLLLLFGLAQAVRYQHYLSAPEAVVSSLFFKVQANVRTSAQVYQTIRTFDDGYVRRVYDYRGQTLLTKPNVYLLFVESYGSVLYKRPDWKRQYTALAEELNAHLTEAGWSAASAFSQAPTWGGGSWMSYTSSLLGLRIDSDPEYTLLMERYQVDSFPDLGSFLRGQGYRYYGLSSIGSELSEAKWDRYLRFYGADRWLRYRDLAYDGPRYGWGPSPPDQFALNRARQLVRQETDQPYLFFTITQNSHYPWAPMPTFAQAWGDLNVAAADPAPIDAEGITHDLRRKNYFDAVEYDLRVLVDFVLSEADPNALFVLVGDHQPPRVSRKDDGWETPIHIISRDKALVESLAEYGFEPGLTVNRSGPALHHAGIRSLISRLLLARYGDHKSPLPAYLPDGMPFTGILAVQPKEGEHPQ